VSKTQRKMFSFWLAAVLIALPSAVVADERAWQVLSELEFPKDKRASFAEVRKTRLQRKEHTQTGLLWLTEDNVLVMSIEQPRTELRKISTEQLSVQRAGKTRSIALDPSRGTHQLPLLIIDVLSGDIEQLKRNFRITQRQPLTKGWSWKLVPIEQTLKKQLTSLILSGEHRRLRSLRTERGASYQELTILADARTDSR